MKRIAVIWSALLLITTITLSCSRSGASSSPPESRIKWETDWLSAFERAKTERKPVLVDFHASWCMYCTLLEKNTFRDARVEDILTTKVVPLKVDTDRAEGNRRARAYGVRGLPTLLIISPDGQVMARIDGYVTPKQLVAHLSRAGIK